MNSFVIIKGEKVKYQTYNKGAKTILLIHGFAIGSIIWEKLIPFLKNYKVICLDLSGFGLNSYLSRKVDLKNQADLINRFIKSYGKINCLIGYSYGGRVVYEYYKKFKPNLDHIIIIAAPFFTSLPMYLIARFINILSLNNFVAKKIFLLGTSFPILHIILKSWRLADLKNKDLLDETMYKLQKAKNYKKVVKSLTSVTYKSDNISVARKHSIDYIYGDKDGGANLNMIKKIIKKDKKGKLTIVKNSYHLLPLEYPSALATIIKKIV